MTVRVRLFAGLREAMGWSDRQVQVAAGPATPLTLWRQLQLADGWTAVCGVSGSAEVGAEPVSPVGCSRPDRSGTDEVPAGSDTLPAGVRVAINQAFAEADTSLADGDELAFLPPISGG